MLLARLSFSRPPARIDAILLAVVVAVAAACDEPRLPTAPDTRQAATTIETVTTIATAVNPSSSSLRQYAYRMPVTLRETTGVGAFISQVTATLVESSGATTVARLSSAETFGTARIGANGTLVSTGVTVTGPPFSLAAVTEMTIHVTFIDDNGHSGSAQTSGGVRLDLTGDWVNRFHIQTMPAADWTLAHVPLVQSGDSVTGELVSRSGVRLPLVGSLGGLSIRGMPTGSSGCANTLGFREFEFINGRATRASGVQGGRCPGTVGGNFELQRGT